MGPLEAPAAPGHPRTPGPKTFPQPPALGLPQAPGASTGFGRTPGPGTAPDTVGSPRSWLWGPGPAAAAALGLLAAPARGHGLGVCCGTPQAGSGFGKPYSRDQSPTTIPVPGPRCYLPRRVPVWVRGHLGSVPVLGARSWPGPVPCSRRGVVVIPASPPQSGLELPRLIGEIPSSLIFPGPKIYRFKASSEPKSH